MFELLRTFSNGYPLSPFAPLGDVARPLTAFASTAVPADVVETADALEVLVDLPGYPADGISVSFENDVLTVEAQRKLESQAGTTHLVSERGFGKVRRTFVINVPIDGAAIAARYEQGVLALTLPKRAEAKPRKIDVKVK